MSKSTSSLTIGSTSDPAVADVIVLGGIMITMDERRTILPEGALALMRTTLTRTLSPKRNLRSWRVPLITYSFS
jgi:hypothetical protein